MTLLNQDLFYLKHGNLGQKKYTLSLHKFPIIRFFNDDMEEQTLRWVNKRIKKFNPYARFSVEHWKNMWAKQFHIRRKKEKRENPKRLYSDSKIVEVIRTSYELGHEHKFITEIIARRANGKIDPITKQDYKYLNKNDIEDLYLLCIESYQQKVNLTTLTITFPGIEEYELFTITSELVIGMIYENSKKEKRVMIHKEIRKFCNATLTRVLEKLNNYKKDVKFGYVDLSPSDAGAE
ncbi:hypothetical protein Tco_0934614 [Tanacetum coccineum]